MSIEAKHSSNRRLLVRQSVQTWPMAFAHLSADWVVKQHVLLRQKYSKEGQEIVKKKIGRPGRIRLRKPGVEVLTGPLFISTAKASS